MSEIHRKIEIIKRTNLKDVLISTVYIGFNGYFETMVFPILKSGEIDHSVDKECERYNTRKQAIKGHEKLVCKYEKELRNKCDYEIS